MEAEIDDYRPNDPEFYQHCLNGCPSEDFERWGRAKKINRIESNDDASPWRKARLKALTMRPYEKANRDAEIIQMIDDGAKLKTVAHKFDISPSRVAQICRKYPRVNENAHHTRKRKRPRRDERDR